VLDELDRNATKYLFANNTDARIWVAEVVTEYIEAFVEADKHTSFSWVTLTPNQVVVAEDAARFTPTSATSWPGSGGWSRGTST
jgi:hypothetical protein